MTRLKLGIFGSGFVALLALAATPGAQAATILIGASPNAPIPDNSIVGVADTESVVASPITLITDVSVTLHIAGGFNGDYYAYLTHGSGFAVLLNRVGRTAANDFGYDDSGIDVTFESPVNSGDIHSYQMTVDPNGGTLTGTWDVDARNVNPTSSVDTSPRTAFLASFNGLDANGDWTLFVADRSPVGTGTLVSWGAEITGVPEPASAALVVLSVAGAAMRRRKR